MPAPTNESADRRCGEEGASALERLPEGFPSLLAAIATGIILTDAASNNIVYLNPSAASLLGLAGEGELLALARGQLLELDGGEAPSWAPDPIAIGVAAESARAARLRRQDGTLLPVLITTSELHVSGETFLLDTLIDVSAWKRSEEEKAALSAELARAQKMESIGALAAGIAHEINTPTQYVGDNTHFLRDAFKELALVLKKYDELRHACAGKAVTDELLGDIDHALEHADVEYLLQEIPQAIEQSLGGIAHVTKIVRAMKEFSHPGCEGTVLVDLNHAIQTTVTVSRNEWKYVATVELELDPELPLVPGRPGELSQALLNLIVNAAQAIVEKVGDGSRGKGTITLRTARNGNQVTIQISDTGVGIPESIRNRIFEPFFTTKGVGKGTGQGLAIVRSVIVDHHRGKVSFESEAGLGTTFTIQLPLQGDGPENDEVRE
ncbi:MAG: ATP-binding protein [Planctomycetota bacterium]